MLKKLTYLLLTWILWLVVFAAGKVGFMLYNLAENSFTAGDVFDVVRHGFSMDMSTAGYLVAVPIVYYILVDVFRRKPKRRMTWSRRDVEPRRWHWWFVPFYTVVAAFLVCAVIMGDSFLYPFWKFKISAVIFTYMDDASGVTNSVSTSFIVWRIVAYVVISTLVAWAFVRVWAKTAGLRVEKKGPSQEPNRFVRILILLLVAGLDFLAIRGGIGTSVQNVGTAYYSPTLFLNHSAVNPAFSLATSFKRADDFGKQFAYFDDAECEAIVKDFYPTHMAFAKKKMVPAANYWDLISQQQADTMTLLTTKRPDVLIVMMEGFGGKFVETLGGNPEVAPNFNSLVKEGVFFDHYYSNSFRTDRGTTSLLSGYVSYPTTSLMRLTDKLPHVPGLAQSFKQLGYATHYLYGGDINFTGTSGYLVGNGFDHIVSDKDFKAADALSSKWGVCDSITTMRAVDMVKAGLGKKADNKHWMMCYQTLSSHEPFEVPYNRLEDPVLNAFAYTDACIGRLISELKATAAWNNLLVILVPDHGFLHELTYENPEFFHCPMLWLGGALKGPRRITALMNQSDLCATLLGQMEEQRDNYPWSRDVLSPDYRYPFVYATFPSGVMFADSTGVTVFDINSSKPITETPAAGQDAAKSNAERLKKAKALLQYSYRRLDALK
ncbi:MAG: sulfatase-like hydrolase/transferase [Bacteroidales bacterium]|nr:sulfatase-like hydrolase/transferase [Bacteroidales bacterium]